MKRPVFASRMKRIAFPNHQKIGKSVRKQREQLKRSQGEVANAIGVTTAYISDLELGKRNWTEELFNKVVKALEQMGSAT